MWLTHPCVLLPVLFILHNFFNNGKLIKRSQQFAHFASDKRNSRSDEEEGDLRALVWEGVTYGKSENHSLRIEKTWQRSEPSQPAQEATQEESGETSKASVREW